MAAEGPAGVPVDFRQEDLYSYVERRIVTALGPDTGGRLHTGRSRNDLNVTTWRMALREHLLATQTALLGLRGTLLRLAAEHAAVVMPGYTHTQHAQPITFGYWLLAAADVLARDQRRLAGALAHADLCPLGAGALTTTAFPLDRDFTSGLLGFAAPLESAYDAVSSRDDALEAAAALAVLMTFVSRLATDLQAWSTWSTASWNWRTATARSPPSCRRRRIRWRWNMPGRRPARCRALAAALAATKNTAFADVNDAVTSVNEPVLDAALRSRRILALIEEVFAQSHRCAARMAQAAAEGFGSATELADVIVREAGLSFRMAHNVVAVVVRDALAAGRNADAIGTHDLDRAAVALFGKPLGITAAAVAQALDPAENIRARTVLGGPAPASMAAMLAARREALARDAEAVAAVAARIAAAREQCFALGRAMAERQRS